MGMAIIISMELPQEMGDVLKVIMNSAKYGIIEQQRAAA